jgi:Cdc6-like AAA superfamily ATPase
MTDIQKFQLISFTAGSVFTPGSPINGQDLFSGRTDQIKKVLGAISQKGYHAILYGERGVGKTSLSNVLGAIMQGMGVQVIAPHVNCDSHDTFSSLWHKVFKEISTSRAKQGIGFGAADVTTVTPLTAQLPDNITPDIVRQTLTGLSQGGNTVLLIFDEFDRIQHKDVTTLMADTIKMLSDTGVTATILLIGVADSVDALIQDHISIERALVQIPMPRMSNQEITQIVKKGADKLGVTFSNDALEEIKYLSQGLPYITHLLALHSVRVAADLHTLTITTQHVHSAIKIALEQWQESIKVAYFDAIKSHQPVNMYKEVLLACALAKTDEFGYFTAAAVRSPLKAITGKNYEIPNFAKHLKDFSDDARGTILQRVGEARRFRHRFASPLMRPYITIRGVAEGMIDQVKIQKLNEEEG